LLFDKLNCTNITNQHHGDAQGATNEMAAHR